MSDLEQELTDDLRLQNFDCGCVWDWREHKWAKNCLAHKKRPAECTCRTPGEDDGATTCWLHHDCSDGSCTHQDE